MPKALFVGGTQHGQVHDLNDTLYLEFPVYGNPNQRAVYVGEEPVSIEPPEISSERYRRQRFRSPSGVRDLVYYQHQDMTDWEGQNSAWLLILERTLKEEDKDA